MADTIITFSNLAQAKSFRLELDNEQNSGSSNFRPGETCFVRLYPANQNPQIRVSLGSAQIVGSNIPQQIEEYLVFARKDTASLQYPCSQLNSWEWKGRDCGTPLFLEEKVKLPQKASGILHINYTTFFDRIAVTCSEKAKILLEAIKEDRYGYIVIDFAPKQRPVYLTVKDACSRSVVPNAQVWVDGVYVGMSDQNGRIYLGQLSTGKHSLRIIKSGYQPTDKDGIANDEFIVEDD